MLAGALAGVALPPLAHARSNWLELRNTHTLEVVNVVYRNTSGFIADAVAKLEHVLRDHRTNQTHAMDPNLYILLSDLAAAAGREPIYEIISGYRSPKSNEMLRQRSNDVAKNSQHVLGRAIDVRLKGFPCSKLRDLAMEMKRGGVGYYERSDFVHLDTGRVRFWTG